MLFTANLYGQNFTKKLEEIRTTRQAKNFIADNPQLHGIILQVDSDIDTSKLQQEFYLKNDGDIFTVGPETYKVFSKKTTTLSRASYIFLDGNELSFKQVDTVRKFILSEHKKGVPFDSLAMKYSMDGNKKLGDTGWFGEGVMAKEFSDALKLHSLSEIFTVDVPVSHWYFVVKKTYEIKASKKMAILQVTTGNR